MITRLRWESARMGTMGHETRWGLMAGRVEVARVEPDYDVGGVMAAGTIYQHCPSIDDAKRAAEEICGAESEHSDGRTPEERAELATGRLYAAAVLKKAQAEAYEQGRADERAVIAAWLKLNAAKAAEQAEIWLSAGKTPDFVGLLVHSEECFETAAFGVEAGAHMAAKLVDEAARIQRERAGL